MSKNSYDIFISYRRDGGAQYARTLQLMLEKKGYKVFLDYDELVDMQFSPQIKSSIHNSAIYLIVLTKGSMARCANEGDWVRRELEQAIYEGKKIIPVNPDSTFDGVPLGVPEAIKNVIEGTQHSDINFGQALNATVDLMVKNRIRPYIRRRSGKIWWIAAAAVIVAVSGLMAWHWINAREIEKLRNEIVFDGERVSCSDDATREQLIAVKEIVGAMQPCCGATFMQGAVTSGPNDELVEPEFETPAHEVEVAPFHIGKFEITIGQWNAIMADNREGDPALPVACVTFDQAVEFTERLSGLTHLWFRLPTESEWEYAAKGGDQPEGFVFAGSDNPDEVACYSSNSDGQPHYDLISTPTSNDLFNMSGNVSEWCDTDFKPYSDDVNLNTDGCKVVRGGSYDSDKYELTVTHREPVNPDTSIPTLGFRVALTK